MNIFFFGQSSFTAQNLLKDLNLKNKIFLFSKKKEKNKIIHFDLNKRNKNIFNNFKIKKIDYLFYFSSFVPVNEKNANWEKCKKINIFGLVHLLEDIKIPIKKIILASSCSVYGSKKKKIFHENSELYPGNFYALSKFMQEKLLQVYCQKNNIDFLCYRIGYVFGRKMKNKRLVKKILLNHRKGKKIKIYNQGLNLNLIHTEYISYLISKTYRKAKGIYNLTNIKQTLLGEFYKILTKKKIRKSSKMNNFSSKKIFKQFKNLKKDSLKKQIMNFENEN